MQILRWASLHTTSQVSCVALSITVGEEEVTNLPTQRAHALINRKQPLEPIEKSTKNSTKLRTLARTLLGTLFPIADEYSRNNKRLISRAWELVFWWIAAWKRWLPAIEKVFAR